MSSRLLCSLSSAARTTPLDSMLNRIEHRVLVVVGAASLSLLACSCCPLSTLLPSNGARSVVMEWVEEKICEYKICLILFTSIVSTEPKTHGRLGYPHPTLRRRQRIVVVSSTRPTENSQESSRTKPGLTPTKNKHMNTATYSKNTHRQKQYKIRTPIQNKHRKNADKACIIICSSIMSEEKVCTLNFIIICVSIITVVNRLSLSL